MRRHTTLTAYGIAYFSIVTVTKHKLYTFVFIYSYDFHLYDYLYYALHAALLVNALNTELNPVCQ